VLLLHLLHVLRQLLDAAPDLLHLPGGGMRGDTEGSWVLLGDTTEVMGVTGVMGDTMEVMGVTGDTMEVMGT